MNVYSTASVKKLLRNRMDEFIYAIVITIVVSALAVAFKTNFWWLGLLLGILLYSIIGFTMTALTIYKMNKLGMHIERFSATSAQMNEAFSGAGNVEKFFYILLMLMWFVVFMIANALGITFLNPNEKWFVIVFQFLLLGFIAKKVIENLSFVIFYSSIVIGCMKIEYAKLEKKLLSNYSGVTDKLTKIKTKYVDEVNYLLERKKDYDPNEIKTYQRFIKELDDILVEILRL